MEKMKKGWVVRFQESDGHLALRIVYCLSVFGKQFTEAIDKGGYGWSKTQAALPYTIAIAFFAAVDVRTGRPLQDKFGPGIVCFIGAILTGLGLIVSSFSSPGNIVHHATWFRNAGRHWNRLGICFCNARRSKMVPLRQRKG